MSSLRKKKTTKRVDIIPSKDYLRMLITIYATYVIEYHNKGNVNAVRYMTRRLATTLKLYKEVI
jgi:hypothetical protein